MKKKFAVEKTNGKNSLVLHLNISVSLCYISKRPVDLRVNEDQSFYWRKKETNVL